MYKQEHKSSFPKKQYTLNKSFIQIPNEIQYISFILSHISSFKINPKQHYILSTFNPNNIDTTYSFLRNINFITKNPSLKYKQSFISLLSPHSILSIIFQCLLHLIENQLEQANFGSLQYFISKLLQDNIISNNDAITIIHFCIVSSLIPRISTHSTNIEHAEWKNKRILQLENIHKVINLLICIDIPSITEDFCLFMNENVLKNKTNYYLVISKTKILSLLYLNDSSNESESIIINFLCGLYKFNYDKEILEVFLAKISSLFYNKENKKVDMSLLYCVIKRNILFLNEIMKMEEKQENMDAFMLNRGFVIENNHTGKNGIIVSKLLIKEGKFSIVFSFNFNSFKVLSDKEYAILALEDENKQKTEMYFYIKDSYLYLEYSNENKQLCSINDGNNYILYVSFEEQNAITVHIKSQDDFNVFTFEIKNVVISRNLKLYVGKYHKKVFEGYIGPVIVFKTIFEKEFISNVFALKGSYEKMLYCKSYKTSQINKYEPSKNNIADETNQSNKEYNEALIYFLKYFDYQKVIAVVYPLYEAIDFSKEKLIYTNSDFIKTTMKFESVPNVTVGDCFCFQNKHIIFEFLKYEGFNFVIFNYEVLTSNFNEQIKSDSTFNTLMDSLKRLMEFTMEFFVTVNINYYIREMRMLLFSLKKCIFKVSEHFLIYRYVNIEQ